MGANRRSRSTGGNVIEYTLYNIQKFTELYNANILNLTEIGVIFGVDLNGANKFADKLGLSGTYRKGVVQLPVCSIPFAKELIKMTPAIEIMVKKHESRNRKKPKPNKPINNVHVSKSTGIIYDF